MASATNPKSDSEFSPKTEIAARIVGRPAVEGSVAGAPDFFPQPELHEQRPPIDEAPIEPANDADVARKSERFVPVRSTTIFTDKRGKALRARIINVSATGVAIEADFRIMPANTVTMVGSKTVTLGRAIRGGQVFVFDKPLDPVRCNPQITL